jgi:hypothetical protein
MDYARAVALAQRLILKNGRAIDVIRFSPTAADANKPWRGPGTPTVAQTVSTTAVFLPHASLGDLGKLGIDEEMLKRVEQVALVAGGATDLSSFNAFVDGGSRWKIDWVRELKPGSTSVLYAIGVKR